MSVDTSHWSEEFFRTYLLLYCSMSDLSVSEREKIMIRELTSPEMLQRVQFEIDDDNDYQSINKLANYLQNHHHSKGDLELIMDDMKKVFNADGKYDVMEQNMFRIVKRILNNANQ